MRTAMWVGGEDLAGGGPVELVRNPATEEPVAEVAAATADQVDRAVAAAGRALPGWRRTPAGERASCCTAWPPGCAPTATSWAG
jgi:acyl-CoA reductase-like NAD-dependent aldehyde dehydrogenase